MLVLSSIGVWPLFHPGLHPTHDGEYHVVRFYEFDTVLRSGVLYPRWAPDFNMGYGIPLFNFVYPLPNYVASLLHFLGLSFIDAFKANLVIATVFGAVCMYLWSKDFWGKLGGLVSSVFYSFAPYRFVDIYIRGSVGEVWSLAFLPFVLWAVTNVIRKNDLRFLPLVSIAIAFLVFSHNILALLFFGFAFMYMLFLCHIYKKYQYINHLILSFVFGLGLSAVFWLPALVEKQYVRGLEVFTVDRHFVELYQLLIPSWGSGFSGEIGQGLSFQIGVLNIFVVILSLSMLFVWRKQKTKRKLLVFFLLSFFVLVFLMLPVSRNVWEFIPLMTYFQFPWRLLSLVILICSFLAGIIGKFKYRYVLATCVVFGSILVTHSYTQPAYYHYRDDNHYLSRSNFIHGTNSPGDVFNTIWFQQKKIPSYEKFTLQNQGTLKNVIIEPTRYQATVDLKDASTFLIHTAFFPGWRIEYLGKNFKLHPNDMGTMTHTLPQGTYSFEVYFADTMIRHISVVVSMASVFGTFVIWFKTRKI